MLVSLDMAGSLAPYLNSENKTFFINQLAATLKILYYVDHSAVDLTSGHQKKEVRDLFLQSRHSSEDVQHTARFIASVVEDLLYQVTANDWGLIKTWLVCCLVSVDPGQAIAIVDSMGSLPYKNEAIRAIIDHLRRQAKAENNPAHLDTAESLISKLSIEWQSYELFNIGMAYVFLGCFQKVPNIFPQLKSCEERKSLRLFSLFCRKTPDFKTLLPKFL
ncbi:MAG: hypothetical protein WCF65_06970 [Parachlamydiaceae bacterium]